MNIFVDIETYSGANLATQGVHRYVADSEFEILLIAYAVEDAEPVVFEPGDCSEAERVFEELYFSNNILWAFNAQFERLCLSPLMGFSANWRDVQARAIYNGLPNSLDNCCKALGIHSKNKDGGNLINLFCVKKIPGKSNGFRSRFTKNELPGEWEKFKEYVLQDVRCEREVWKQTAPLPETEEEIWLADQKINDRGVPADIEFVNGAAEIDEKAEWDLKATLAKATGLANPKSKSQMKGFLESRTGTAVGSLDKDATKSLIESTQDPELADILRLQAQLSMSSCAKYKVIKKCLCSDGRVHGLLKYYGANTGRWSGKLVQMQNLPNEGTESIDLARDLVKSRDYEMLALLYGNVRGTLSGLIRTAFTASPGHTLIVADYSAIEARVIAWLAGERWREEVFATHGKIYEASAAQMFNIPVDSVTKEQRKKGKIAELALGYGGGVNALKAFGADKLGLSEEELASLVRDWRDKSPAIGALWRTLGRGAIQVAETGNPLNLVGNISLRLDKGHLILKLPSGRELYYREVFFDKERLCYKCRTSMAQNGYGVAQTYGGKLTENVIQSIARDLLASALLRLESKGFRVLFHVHDEIICEVPKTDAELKLKEMIDIMCHNPEWAEGLHLKAAGFISPYYKKD